jgi:hypothetical protein
MPEKDGGNGADGHGAVLSCMDRLLPTAALVMAWAEPLYREGPAAAFFHGLDLSPGREILEACRRICPWYAEVILNRKSLITELAVAAVEAFPEPCTVLIPAAGMSPLSLVLLDRCGDRIGEIREYDLGGMEEKERLYHATDPGPAAKIRCITADITAPGFLLSNRDDRPVIAIAEGISYYLPRPTLGHLLATLPAGRGHSRVIIDYLLPDALISPSMRRNPGGVFGIIDKAWEGGKITRYTPEEIAGMAQVLGGAVIRQYSSREMEAARTGKNRFFRAEPDGWIAVADIRI